MKKVVLANKGGVYWKLLKKINDKNKTNSKSYLSFKDVFDTICSPFILTRQDAWEVMAILRDLSLIEFVPCHGIRLNFEVKNG